KCGGEDHRRLIIDDLQHLEAIDFRHLDIQENDIGLILHDGFCTLKTVVAFGHDGHLGVSLKVLGNHASRQGLIINQYRFNHNWGILIMLVKIWLVDRVSNRSVRPNNKNSRRWMPRSPNPVPLRGLLLSLS